MVKKSMAIKAVIAWHVLDCSFFISSLSSLITQLADFLRAADPCFFLIENFVSKDSSFAAGYN
jgi:hypothetical protein